MFNFFKRKPKVNIENLGVIPDPRTPEEKEQDYKSEELFSVSPIVWMEKPESEWRKFPIFFQDYSSSCVAQAIAKALGIENWLEEQKFVQFSARDIYTRRLNRPQEGMYFTDGMNIGRKNGATIEQLMPSQGLNEPTMNVSEDRTPLTEAIAKIGRGGNNITLPNDIEAVASIIEPNGKPVVLGVRFNIDEWSKPVPTVSANPPKYGHGITGTNAILYQGKKSIIIEDSWGIDTGLNGRRVLTEDWFKAGRIVFAGYYDFLKNDGLEVKPKYQFSVNLKYGTTNSVDVKHLQECLAYLKLFPARDVFTGNFYGLTMAGVKAFQVLNGLLITGICEEKTRAKLNEQFA